MSNVLGILLARESAMPGTLSKGLSKSREGRIFVPEGIGHYSIKGAFSWLGMGESNVRYVRTDEHFRMDQDDLVRQISDCLSEGCVPIGIVAYAGDSRTMAIDDMVGIRKIADEYGIWFHVDACHGFALCFNETGKKMVAGLESADSITIDPHKTLWIPYSLSFLLVRDSEKLRSISGFSDLITSDPFSLGQTSPFIGSKPFNSLKLWMLIKHLGRKGIGEHIEKRLQLAKKIAETLEKLPGIRIMNDVTINSIMFVFAPDPLLQEARTDSRKVEAINALNSEIHSKMLQDGQFYAHSFPIQDFGKRLRIPHEGKFIVHRIMVGNPGTDLNSIRMFGEWFLGIANDAYKRSFSSI